MTVKTNGHAAALVTATGDVIISKIITSIWQAWDMAQEYGARLEIQ